MIRKLLLAAAVSTLAIAPSAFADEAKFNTTTTLLGAILDNPEAKAAFAKVFPEIAASDQLEQGRDFTLTQIAEFVPDQFTPEKLKELNDELAKIK